MKRYQSGGVYKGFFQKSLPKFCEKYVAKKQKKQHFSIGLPLFSWDLGSSQDRKSHGRNQIPGDFGSKPARIHYKDMLYSITFSMITPTKNQVNKGMDSEEEHF